MIKEIYDSILPEGIKQIWRNHKARYRKRFAYSNINEVIECSKWIKEIGLINGGNSQQGQDVFAFALFGGKKNGLFLDIGGNDPIRINNTFYLEKKGWDGLAFEPQPLLQKKWKSRRTSCIPIALGSRESYVKLKVVKERNDDNWNVLSKVLEDENHISTNEDDSSETIRVKQRKLADVLKENGIKEVDYISLDVEGYEMQVLEGIEWDDTKIKVISIEIDEREWNKSKIIRKYLYYHGFRLVARLQCDDIWASQVFLNSIMKNTNNEKKI